MELNTDGFSNRKGVLGRQQGRGPRRSTGGQAGRQAGRHKRGGQSGGLAQASKQAGRQTGRQTDSIDGQARPDGQGRMISFVVTDNRRTRGPNERPNEPSSQGSIRERESC